MTRSRVLLIALVFVLAGCKLASAQEGPGAGKLEVGGYPGGGLWLVSGDNNTEANFNNYAYGGGASWYVDPRVAIEAELAFGLGMAQGINFRNREWVHVQAPNSLSTSGNLVFFPGGTARRVAGYVAGGAGMMSVIKRDQTKQYGVTSSSSHLATNIGGGVKFFRGGDARNWGIRFDYRLMMVNSNSSADTFFAQSKRRMGHRIYLGMLYTIKR